ncbi:hypothetical protein DAETH_42230 (plasmid) [Deinococcus aetherius]|uniref:Transposase IS204/IS1001/IS1096/IS1165 DDE domain-containing protein n=1 Tax=Deinococcus aetherius TaxID=200252 RepID=A0ABM8AKA3_9DEIO|nr:hypothetical protein DAETH_42230 [Deinococcus aetherius]
MGIDDFALRKGIRYGTVVVDLDTRKPIDLLQGGTVQTVSSWLAAHPEIEVVSRDRWTEYERGVTLGAPQATQVMDRWHVVKNLREALERQLQRSQTSFDAAKLELMPEPTIPRTAREEAERQRRYERRQAKVARVKEMHAVGKPIAVISRELRCSKHFVRFSLRVDVVPETRHRARKSAIDAYDEYLWQQWQAGERNARELLRQIQAQGYPNG